MNAAKINRVLSAIRNIEITYALPIAEKSRKAQQIAEKMLKSVAELVCTGIEKLMTSHNLRALYDEIKRVDTSLQLERKDLALLKDYYYDARYPGDNFVIVTVDELREALEIMLDVVEAVNGWRTSHELEILIADPRGEFQSAMSRLK